MTMLTKRALLAGLAAAASVQPGFAAGRRFVSGGVASPDAPGAEVGAAILRAGGNAVDAGVAIGFALAVTYPEAGNLGGGGFMTILVNGRPAFIDYRETAPASATASMYLDASGEVIDGRSLVGNQAAGVPGTVAGLARAHRRFGRLPWAQVLVPAIGSGA
jgi:gamma-glutamyltranspeptidase / glutathione hydrolase